MSSPKKARLKRVKTAAFLDDNWKSFSSSSQIPFSTKVCSDNPRSNLGEYLDLDLEYLTDKRCIMN